MKNGISLQICIAQYCDKWAAELKEDALSGKIEGMIMYAKLLLRGSDETVADAGQAVFWLQKASFVSAEASFILGKLFKKGRKVEKDEEKAYFYYRIASSFKCKCGRMADEYHSYQITNVSCCFPFEAKLQLRTFDGPHVESLEARFQQWINSFDLQT